MTKRNDTPRIAPNFMDTPASFDLNSAIQRWRENLGQSPALRGENLDELESHLRDSVVTLQTRGLSAKEAFAVAAARVGGGDVLGAEFAKVNARAVWLDRFLWMLIGIQVWGWVVGLVSSLSSSALSFGLIGSGFNFATHGPALPTVLFALVRVLAFAASLALCWWLIVRQGNTLGSYVGRFLHRRRSLVLLVGVLSLISLVGSGVGFGPMILLLKFVNPSTNGELALSTQYANMFASLAQTVALIAITLLLARQRLRMKSA
jgi:hypothetical protein